MFPGKPRTYVSAKAVKGVNVVSGVKVTRKFLTELERKSIAVLCRMQVMENQYLLSEKPIIWKIATGK